MKRQWMKRGTKPMKRSWIRRGSRPMKRLSDRMREAWKVYGKRWRVWIKYKYCKPCEDRGIYKLAECVHHKRGRHSIERLLNEADWIPSCYACNNFIEEEKAWARANGYLGNRQADKPVRA